MEEIRKINTYTCPDGHVTVTIERVVGVTSMFITCSEMKENGCSCDKNAKSAFYMVDQTLEPEFEWYKPETGAKLSEAEADHCRLGGLLLRSLIPRRKLKKEPTPGRNTACRCGSGLKYKKCCLNKSPAKLQDR